MFLAGTHELVIDAKNRLSVPFAIRRKLSEETDGQSFYVVPGRRQGTLALYPEKYFERLRENLPADDNLTDETYACRQFEFSQSALLEPDNQGRVLIPERLLKNVGMAKDVALIGVRDHLELWNRAEFEAFEAQMWPGYPDRRAKSAHEMRALATAPEAAAAPRADRAAP